MSKVRQEPELQSLKASKGSSPSLQWGDYVVVALIWQVGRHSGGRVECLGVKNHAKAGISPLQSGVPRFSEAEDHLDRLLGLARMGNPWRKGTPILVDAMLPSPMVRNWAHVMRNDLVPVRSTRSTFNGHDFGLGKNGCFRQPLTDRFFLGPALALFLFLFIYLCALLLHSDWRLPPSRCSAQAPPLSLECNSCSLPNEVVAGPVCLAKGAFFRLLGSEEALCTYIV